MTAYIRYSQACAAGLEALMQSKKFNQDSLERLEGELRLGQFSKGRDHKRINGIDRIRLTVDARMWLIRNVDPESGKIIWIPWRLFPNHEDNVRDYRQHDAARSYWQKNKARVFQSIRGRRLNQSETINEEDLDVPEMQVSTQIASVQLRQAPQLGSRTAAAFVAKPWKQYKSRVVCVDSDQSDFIDQTVSIVTGQCKRALVCLAGAPGSGKTLVANELVQKLLGTDVDAVYYLAESNKLRYELNTEVANSLALNSSDCRRFHSLAYIDLIKNSGVIGKNVSIVGDDDLLAFYHEQNVQNKLKISFDQFRQESEVVASTASYSQYAELGGQDSLFTSYSEVFKKELYRVSRQYIDNLRERHDCLASYYQTEEILEQYQLALDEYQREYKRLMCCKGKLDKTENILSTDSLLASFDAAQRKKILKTYQRYHRQIIHPKLTRLFVSKSHSGMVGLNDRARGVLIVDEALDLSRLQLIHLMQLGYKVVFLGDYHQDLKHAANNWEYIRHYGAEFLVKRGIKVTDLANSFYLQKLVRTYRLSQKVTDTANKLLELKKALMSHGSDLVDSTIYTVSDEIGCVSEMGKQPASVIKHMCRQRSTAVIYNRDLITKSEAQLQTGTALCFTVEDIKGLEYDSIVLWELITPDLARKLNALRKRAKRGRAFISPEDKKLIDPINALYTAITRARFEVIIKAPKGYENHNEIKAFMAWATDKEQVVQHMEVGEALSKASDDENPPVVTPDTSSKKSEHVVHLQPEFDDEKEIRQQITSLLLVGHDSTARQYAKDHGVSASVVDDIQHDISFTLDQTAPKPSTTTPRVALGGATKPKPSVQDQPVPVHRAQTLVEKHHVATFMLKNNGRSRSRKEWSVDLTHPIDFFSLDKKISKLKAKKIKKALTNDHINYLMSQKLVLSDTSESATLIYLNRIIRLILMRREPVDHHILVGVLKEENRDSVMYQMLSRPECFEGLVQAFGVDWMDTLRELKLARLTFIINFSDIIFDNLSCVDPKWSYGQGAINKIMELYVECERVRPQINNALLNALRNLYTEKSDSCIVLLRLISRYSDILKLGNLDVNADMDGDPLIFKALRNNCSGVVTALLDMGADPDKANDEEIRPLQRAIISGKVCLVEKLLPMSDPNYRTTDGKTPLSFAICMGNNDIVNLLLKDSRVNVDLYFNDNGQAVFSAIFNQNIDALTAIVKHTPSVVNTRFRTNKNASGQTVEQNVIHTCATKGFVKGIKFLVSECGLDVNACDTSGGEPMHTPLHLAAAHSSEPSIEALVELGADLKAEDANGFLPLHASAASSRVANLEKIMFLSGQSVNTVSSNGVSCLIAAARFNSNDMVAWLISNGAAVEHSDSRHPTALDWAMMNHNAGLVKMLLTCDAPVNLAKNHNNTKLHMAAFIGCVGRCELAITDSDINKINGFGETALWLAVNEGHIKVVEFLISKNANQIIQRHADSMTALMTAVWSANVELIDLLDFHEIKSQISTKYLFEYAQTITDGEHRAQVIDACVGREYIELTPNELAILLGRTNVIALLKDKQAKLHIAESQRLARGQFGVFGRDQNETTTASTVLSHDIADESATTSNLSAQ